MFLTNAKKNKYVVYTSLNKGFVFVPYYAEQTFSTPQLWKLPFHVRFPHVPMFKCQRRSNCENFDVETKKKMYIKVVFEKKSILTYRYACPPPPAVFKTKISILSNMNYNQIIIIKILGWFNKFYTVGYFYEVWYFELELMGSCTYNMLKFTNYFLKIQQ